MQPAEHVRAGAVSAEPVLGGRLGHVNNHHHVEVLLYDGLRDIQDIDVLLCQIGTNSGDDTFCIDRKSVV